MRHNSNLFRIFGKKKYTGPTEVSTEPKVALDREELDQMLAQDIVAEMQKQNTENRMDALAARKKQQEKMVQEYMAAKKKNEQFFGDKPGDRTEAAKRIEEAMARLR